MTRTAVVAALHDELASVLELMPDEHKLSVAGREFWVGHLHGHDVVAVLSGVGKVAAATTATVLAERFEVDRMVFTGVAGGLGGDVKVGDIVVAREFLQHDMDASPIFPRHEVPLYGRKRFEAHANLTDRVAKACREALVRLPEELSAETIKAFSLQTPAVHEGLLISGDRFVSARHESEALRAELPDALAVEMEGAAFSQVCFDYGIPLAVVRTISDRADDEAHVDFPKFLKQVASRYSGLVMDSLLREWN